MKVLALEIEKTTNVEDFAPYLQPEAAGVWKLHQAGVIRELYFRADQHTAVLVLECADVEEARQVLASLPLVRARLIEFEIIPLVAYPGFARLFAFSKLSNEGEPSTEPRP